MQIINDLLNDLKDIVLKSNEEEWRSILTESYTQFVILDTNKKWCHEIFSKNANELLPEKELHQNLLRFLDDVVAALYDNEYLLTFLKDVSYSLKDFNPSGPHSKEEHLKYMISFAFTLDRLNTLARKDLDVLEVLVSVYKINRKKNNFYRFKNILAIIKFHSIELPLVRFLKAKKKGKLSSNFGKYILSLNIFEATLVDFATGFSENAKSTFPLIFFSPNYRGMGFIKKYERGKPSSFSPDGKALLMFSPAAKEWADLYQVWNMALVAQFSQAGYLLIKLLIPSVGQYKDRPAEYMHTRITALHLTMNYLDSAMNAPKIKIDLKNLGAVDKSLVKKWGQVNYECSQKYTRLISK